MLIELANQLDAPTSHNQRIDNLPDQELDLRQPDIAAWYFGDCAGQLVFIPNEPEYDNNGQPIINEVIGYDEKGGEVWS